MIAAIEEGFPQKEIQEASYQLQRAIEKRDEVVVGVNEFVTENEPPIEFLQIGPEAQECQTKRLKSLRKRRNGRAVSSALADVKQTAVSNKNLMPPLVEAARAYVTVGEMVETLKEVFGTYQEPSF